ncbi:MAG TPA: 2-amino-4-hydroxy-6-hydroxymethyldihydropteridine diphosphokinase [Dehalococcoidia bacterium]|nr:2-amino-4-hydroxy-6-hydroxymethyldihydropteridine diphosphokinase [Dehalococcoidia bacterium]
MSTVYIALGANLGNREANLRMALRAITRMARVHAVSALYESEPEGGVAQPAYYNAVCRIETGLEPLPLLRFLKGLEHEIGRRPTAEPKGPRPIDLDILLFDDRVVESDDLVIPHPRMTSRPFVLTPLAELAPEVVVPGTGETAAALAKKAGEAGLRQIAPAGWDAVAGAPQRMRL